MREHEETVKIKTVTLWVVPGGSVGNFEFPVKSSVYVYIMLLVSKKSWLCPTGDA